jgi:hypothetical protein
MVTYKTQTQASQQYKAWEGLVRAASASAAGQSRDVIRAVTVSHRTDGLCDQEVDAILGLARGLADDRRLSVETEISLDRLVLRFSRGAVAESDTPTGRTRRHGIWGLFSTGSSGNAERRSGS